MRKISRICFIAPSTCLPRSEKRTLNKTINLLKKAFEVKDIYISPYLFSSDEEIDHVTAPAAERAEEFKMVIREYDLIISVAGGTGAEDILRKTDKKDFRVIRDNKPIFVGFSDFTFLLNEVYHASRVPVIYFPSLRIGKGNFSKIHQLLTGEEIHDMGVNWLTPPPPRRISGVPIGGNLTTFVNFLNRQKPPNFNWKKHILFFEDIQVDVEDLHRLLAALRRHRVFRQIKGVVIGRLTQYSRNSHYRKQQREALYFIKTFLTDVIKRRRRQGYPLPILAVNNFGHNVKRNLMAVPIGGHVTISKSRRISFRITKAVHRS